MAKKAKKARKTGNTGTNASIHRIEDFSPPSWAGYWGVTTIPDLMAPAHVRMPRVDMLDLGEEIRVEVELPGVRAGDVKLSAADNSVNIRALDHPFVEQPAGEYFYREIGRGEYQRVLLLPCGVDWDQAKAKLRGGILVLRLPKREAGAGQTQPQAIPVD